MPSDIGEKFKRLFVLIFMKFELNCKVLPLLANRQIKFILLTENDNFSILLLIPYRHHFERSVLIRFKISYTSICLFVSIEFATPFHMTQDFIQKRFDDYY